MKLEASLLPCTLIADSGATKTDWCLLTPDGTARIYSTCGLNPYFFSEDEIVRELSASLLPKLADAPIEAVHFYGAGCIHEPAEVMRCALNRCFPYAHIAVQTDMLGAARALCGHSYGIACILGTGSNSCLYDGQQIIANVSPLGYILGDEGSGAVLGKLLVSDVLKRQLPADICSRFFERFGLTQAEIIDRVYRQPNPNRFLASLSPFLAENIHEPILCALVCNSFTAFIRRNVMQYEGWNGQLIHFCGSVAWHYRPLLQKVADATGIRVGNILQRPMEGLVRYHASTTE